MVQHEEALCAEAVTLAWGLVQGLATNPHDFWLALKGFVSTAFQHKLLQLSDSQAPTLVSTLKQVIRNAPSHIAEIFRILSSCYKEMRLCCSYLLSRFPLSWWSCPRPKAECLACCLNIAAALGCRQTGAVVTWRKMSSRVFSATSTY